MTAALKKTPPRKKPGRGRPKQEDLAERESKLLDIATAEFLEHGYGGASLNRIVANAGISKTTLYSRYTSKAELFRAIIQQQIKTMAPESVFSDGNDRLPLEQGLKAFANHALERSFRGDMLEINRLMYSESARFPELGEAAADRTARGIKRVAEYIDNCATFDKIPCRDAHSVAEVFVLAIRGWYMNIMLTNRKVSATARKRWADSLVIILLASREQW